MHGNQWVLKIAVLKYYSVSKRGTTAKSNPKQATDPISLHTKFGDNSSNTFPLNERKPCVTPDIGRRTPDIGHRTAKKAKIIYPPPRGVDIINNNILSLSISIIVRHLYLCQLVLFKKFYKACTVTDIYQAIWSFFVAHWWILKLEISKLLYFTY